MLLLVQQHIGELLLISCPWGCPGLPPGFSWDKDNGSCSATSSPHYYQLKPCKMHRSGRLCRSQACLRSWRLTLATSNAEILCWRWWQQAGRLLFPNPVSRLFPFSIAPAFALLPTCSLASTRPCPCHLPAVACLISLYQGFASWVTTVLFEYFPSGWAHMAGSQAGLHHIVVAPRLPGGLICGVALVSSLLHPTPARSLLLSAAFPGFHSWSQPPGLLRLHRYFKSRCAAPPRAFAYRQMLGTHKHHGTPGAESCLACAAQAQTHYPYPSWSILPLHQQESQKEESKYHARVHP